jgi:hypothetical protein
MRKATYRTIIGILILWTAWFWLAKFQMFQPNAANFWAVLVLWTAGVVPLGILALVVKPRE